mgnify:CR=1 FL=1
MSHCVLPFWRNNQGQRINEIKFSEFLLHKILYMYIHQQLLNFFIKTKEGSGPDVKTMQNLTSNW